jgi:CelD/BcsL family acetyltransferase involved in cellulose biosynthesis
VKRADHREEDKRMRHARLSTRSAGVPARTSSSLKLVATGPETRAAWRALVDTSPSVQLMQTPQWQDCMCALAPYEDASRLYETPDGRQIVVPLVRHRRSLAGAPLEASTPHPWDHGTPLVSGGARAEDLAELINDLGSRRVLRTTLRMVLSDAESSACESAAPPHTFREITRHHVLDLSGGFDAVWNHRFTSKVRSASRKALRRGVRVESDAGDRLMPAFAELYRKSVDRWAADRGEPIFVRRWLTARRAPLSAFAEAARRLRDHCRVWIAFHDGRPVAGTIILTHGDQVTYWKGAMDKQRVAGTGANELLHRCAIEQACASGGRSYFMGPSLDRYKRSFGTTTVAGMEYRFESWPVSSTQSALRAAILRAARARRRRSLSA